MAPGIFQDPVGQDWAADIPQWYGARSSGKLFDPARHLAYAPPRAVHTLQDLCLPDSPISPVASTDPFPLLSEEALIEHRRELLSDAVLENCLSKTGPGSAQLRGMVPRYAPFIHQFWTSPEVLRIVSVLAGVELVPVFDYDISHTNIQLDSDSVDDVKKIPVFPPGAPAPNESNGSEGTCEDVTRPAKHAIVPWHRDSYPFVCVVMLSDARHMTGGETEIQRGDGTTTKVRSPQMGGAVILQGRHVSHVAHPAGNMPERITIVTSFRPRSSMLLDDSSLMNVRNKSVLPELFYQWSSYRLRLLAERFRAEAESLDRAHRKAVQGGKKGEEIVNVERLREWMDKQAVYMKRTVFEMRPFAEGEPDGYNEILEMPM